MSFSKAVEKTRLYAKGEHANKALMTPHHEGSVSVHHSAEDQEEMPWLDQAPAVRRMIVVGGGKAGVGKSLVALNLAVYIAQLGKRVLLVDADPTGASLHLWLGIDRPVRTLREKFLYPTEKEREKEAFANVFDASLTETSVTGLQLLPAPLEASAVASIKGVRRARMMQWLRTVNAEYIIIDAGPGITVAALDLFLLADLSVMVTIPEPASVETSYRFLRALFLHQLRKTLKHEPLRLRSLDRILGDMEPWPNPLEFSRFLAKSEPQFEQVAADTLCRIRPRLIVNQVRVRGDFDLGPSMAHIAQRHLGLFVDPVGPIEHDDSVWLAHRRRKPLLVDGPSTKAGRCLERIARRLLAVLPQRSKEAEHREPLPSPLNHYTRLGVPRGASEEEIRKALKRERDIYMHDGLPVLSVFTADTLDREHALLEEAHDVLIDPQKRRTYDNSIFGEEESRQLPMSPNQRAQSEALTLELLQQQALLAREIGPDTEFSGDLLRRVRESKGIDLKTLSNITKVSVAHLSAIESELYEQLPPPVYVRGFVMAMARVLALDPLHVARTYLRRAREVLDIRS